MFNNHLDSHFWQVNLHGEFLPAVDVRVVGLLESSLQLVQLIRGEGCSVPPVFLLVGIVLTVNTRTVAALSLTLHM